MGEFIKPLRRKLGVVTLLMVCLNTSYWIELLVSSSQPGSTVNRIYLLEIAGRSIVLTVVSAFLLLTKPRPQTLKKPAEPIPEMDSYDERRQGNLSA